MGKIYFVSDLHLGVPGSLSSRDRERNFVQWLDEVASDAEAIYLMGDLFDFYFEYKTVVPKGYVRILGKLAALSDAGIEMHFFIGNHDMWIFNYFEKELGIPTHRGPIIKELQGKKCFIAHGDGLGPGDKGYKILKKIFANKLCQWLFERIHPNLGIGIANYWSQKSRYANPEEIRFIEEKEWLVNFARDHNQENPMDYYIFGHRHLPIHFELDKRGSTYINTGEWLHSQSYAVMEEGQIAVKFFKHEKGRVFP